jgi:hypothetical protein
VLWRDLVVDLDRCVQGPRQRRILDDRNVVLQAISRMRRARKSTPLANTFGAVIVSAS